MRTTLYPELAEKIEGLGRRGQVLAGIWAGKGTKEIAADLGLSPKTVEYHRAQLYRVFGVNDLVSLCRRAIAVGLIDPRSEGRDPGEGCRRQCVTHARRIANAYAIRGGARRVGRQRERRLGPNMRKTEQFEGGDAGGNA
ncbi:MAG TPA: LuxR C-terminal-related transcriptional regulator [Verrucomicrobiota bacterium]|jgi:DNA-binding CsgD family transcriptional regulator|nr:LuxR C-terminal-related transcriptional regulator [Verrucomicrobiota bacterium]HQL79456.1 LuxR C-terminal-related transcriptional regulator [Verrucomicrobiota bacterium]